MSARRSRRAPKACTFCRQRKMRCNNGLPECGNCKEYGKTCTYDAAPSRPRPSNARLASLEEENRRLRESLHRAQSRETTQTPGLQSSPVHGADLSDASDVRLVEAVQPTRRDSGETQESTRSAIDVDTGSRIGVSPRSDTSVPATPDRLSAARPEASNGIAGSSLAVSRTEIRYHGPTSTLFADPAAQETRGACQTQQHRQGTDRIEASRPGPSPYWVQKGLFAEAAAQRHRETINLAAGQLDFDGVDPELGMHLLRLHWNRQHHSFLITYRPAFMRDMACGGPYFSKLLLNAIFFGAAKFSTRPELRRDAGDVRTAGWLFRERVRQLLGGALDRSDITTIQALLVMTSSLFALGDERSAAWLYAGTAFRMIIDLGLHVDGGGRPDLQLTDEDVEIRRRVFWGAFVVDKIQSLYQGRPVSLQEMETGVPLVFQDTYEELEHWRPFAYGAYAGRSSSSSSSSSARGAYPGSPAYSVSCFTQLCRLSLIMNRILSAVYAERSVRKKPDELADDLTRLHADLATWKAELPPHLDFDPAKEDGPAPTTPPPHVLSLLAMHNVLLILLHRPFVSDGHLHAHLRALAASSFLTCAQAAAAIVALLRAYNAAFSVRRAPYLVSYATYVAATIHVRIAAQPGAAVAAEAKEALAMCLTVFDENSETNSAVKMARAVIANLMRRMGVHVVASGLAVEGDAENAENAENADTAGRRILDAENTDEDRMQPPVSELPHHRGVREQGRRDETATGNLDMPAVAVGPFANAASPAASFDIEAIISSFISDQQPPPAAAFKSLPTPNTPGRPPFTPSSSGTVSSSAAQLSTAPPWFAQSATLPTMPSSSSLYPAVPPSAHRRMAGYGPLLADTRQNAIQDHAGAVMAGWQQSTSLGSGDRINIHASDLLFGFNSSAVEGIGWEFEAINALP